MRLSIDLSRGDANDPNETYIGIIKYITYVNIYIYRYIDV